MHQLLLGGRLLFKLPFQLSDLGLGILQINISVILLDAICEVVVLDVDQRLEVDPGKGLT